MHKTRASKEPELKPYYLVSVSSKERDYATYVSSHLAEALGRVSQVMAVSTGVFWDGGIADEVVRVDLRLMDDETVAEWQELYREHREGGSL